MYIWWDERQLEEWKWTSLFTYIYVAYSYRNGQSEHSYLVCREVRKLFLFWITLYVSTANFHQKHPIRYFIFAYAVNIWESQEKNVFVLQRMYEILY